jgi:thermostable 8-oxoguanine DNA glycosylase
MKKSELRRLVAEYEEIKIKFTKTQNNKLKERLKEIEHRYYHETGRLFVPDTKEIT